MPEHRILAAFGGFNGLLCDPGLHGIRVKLSGEKSKSQSGQSL
jgi:hypothetical protein